MSRCISEALSLRCPWASRLGRSGTPAAWSSTEERAGEKGGEAPARAGRGRGAVQGPEEGRGGRRTPWKGPCQGRGGRRVWGGGQCRSRQTGREEI